MARHEFTFAPPPHPSTQPVEALLAQCVVERGRAGGPGGQHRNKVETLIRIVHTPTGIEAHAGERRSAEENKQVALARLRLALAVWVRTPVPDGEARSALWLTRCPERGGGRIVCNPSHADFPALLAEGLDMLAACGLDVRRAALRLCCSPSQLVKLLKDHPAAIVRFNEARAQRQMHPLR
ncbi:MAG: peptide chain release factor-like protein [Phycisphaeraceae bacterium]|nr:peptide chain release factor-like protein [Phycisphaeraceae bacterium]